MGISEKVAALGELTGYPVEQDEYEGTGERYIVFTYEDERGSHWGDDRELAVTTWLQVSLFVPKTDDYSGDKKKIRDYLSGQGFQVESVQVWLEKLAGKRMRRITFSVTMTEIQEEKEDGNEDEDRWDI